MAFELRFHEDQTTGLVAVCDTCGKILRGDEGNILWRPKGTEVIGHFHPYRIACKSKCTDLLDQTHGRQYSQCLDTAIGYLMNNAKLDLKHVHDQMRMLAQIAK